MAARSSAGDLITSFWARNAASAMRSAVTKKKPVQPQTNRWKIVAGDFVEVINGHCIGERGKVLQVMRNKNRVIIDNVNMRVRHVMRRDLSSSVPIKDRIQAPCSLHYSNIALIDPTIDKPTKIARRYLEDGTKVRISKKTGAVILAPPPHENKDVRSVIAGPLDTEAADVLETTFPEYEKYLEFIYTKGLKKDNDDEES